MCYACVLAGCSNNNGGLLKPGGARCIAAVLILPINANVLQAAEERSLAGKCGNPLCSHAPAGALQAAPSSSSGSSGRRYHISAREQAVYELPGAADQPLYCGGGCETAVAAFAARLGSGALALERFTALYRQLKAREGAATSAAAATAQAQTQEPLQLTDAAEAPAAAQPASAESSKAASSSSSGAAGGIGSDPGSIGSAQSLVPRLAVEQVPVKLIDSSAGQFGDFSYKPKPRAAAAAAGAQGAAPVKGVLKKRSQFAAGSTKVPIMLAEVKVREGLAGRAGGAVWPSVGWLIGSEQSVLQLSGEQAAVCLSRLSGEQGAVCLIQQLWIQQLWIPPPYHPNPPRKCRTTPLHPMCRSAT